MGILGKKLRELRGNRTAYEVSKATGIPSADIMRYENDEYHPKPATLKKLADYFQVEYKELRILYYEDTVSPDKEECLVVLEWAERHKRAHSTCGEEPKDI